ncbi:MAG: hypothetical protein ACRETZ_19200, partial [Steroidobacteraceae bacterium]
WEYFLTLSIRNDRGEEVDRQVVNVGALHGAEKRTFTLSVEVLPPHAPEEEEDVPQVTASPAPAAAKAPAAAAAPGTKPAAPPEAPKLPRDRPAPRPAASGIRLSDGTLLTPPGLGPKRK